MVDFKKIDEILKNAILDPNKDVEALKIDFEFLTQSISPELAKRVDDIKEKIAKEFGDLVADIVTGLLNALLNLIVLGGLGVGYGFGLFDVGRVLGQRQALEEFQIYIPSPSETLELLYKGLISESKAEDIFKQHGISSEWFQLLKSAGAKLISPEQIRELYRRKFITTKTAFDLLKQHGYDHVQASLLLGLAFNRLSVSEGITAWLRGLISEQELDELLEINGYFGKDKDVIKQLAYYIPSVSDLIRLAVREAFNPEAIAKFKLDEDLPSEFLKWAEAQGLSREWAIRYWVAHWELPSITQALEMFHRTTKTPIDEDADAITSPFGEVRYNVIGRQTLRRLLKAQDISPFWRDKIEAISYTPLTRVDIRRAYDLGVIDENDVYFAYRDLGYNHENATILTEFTILETISEERTKIRNELIELYEEGAITKEELQNALISLRYNSRTIEILLEYAEFRKVRKRIERLKKYYKALFMRGDIDEDELHDMLVRLGLEPDEVIALIDEWKIEKIAKERTLSLSQIEEAYRKRIIDEQKAREKLKRLGYNDEDIDILIKLWR